MYKIVLGLVVLSASLCLSEEIQRGKGRTPRDCTGPHERNSKWECAPVLHATDMVVHDTERPVKAVYRIVQGKKVKVPFGQHKKVKEPGKYTLMIQVNKPDSAPEVLQIVYK